jgi:glucuronate isomerase
MRNPNEKKFETLGPDTGFDWIAVTDSCAALYGLMNALEKEDNLLLYELSKEEIRAFGNASNSCWCNDAC